MRTKKEGIPVGVPLPTFLLTQRVCSSTISTSENLLFYFTVIIKHLFLFVKNLIFTHHFLQIFVSDSPTGHN